MTEPMKVNEVNDRLFDIFRNHNFSHISHDQRGLLARYFLILQNSNINATRFQSLRNVAIKHFIDCLMIPQLTSINFPLMDLGTGLGLPGIPIKILYPQAKIVLTESVLKRVDFLKMVSKTLQLQNLMILGKKITGCVRFPVQGVITRAVEPVSETLKKTANCLGPGGRVYFMKGPNCDHELSEVLDSGLLLTQLYSLEKDIHYTLPNTPHQRRLIVFLRNASE